MAIVDRYPLEKGHTCQLKETLQIRIAEEANLQNIKVKVVKSCNVTYEVVGPNFHQEGVQTV